MDKLKPKNQYAYDQILGGLHRRGAKVNREDLRIQGTFESKADMQLAITALIQKYTPLESDYNRYGVWPSVSDDCLTLTFEFDEAPPKLSPEAQEAAVKLLTDW